MNNLPALPSTEATVFTPDLVRQIAMDIGKAVAAHIEIMYPRAVEATTPNMLVSVRNCVHNEIIGALNVIDEKAILDRLERRKQNRRRIRAAYRKIRKEDQ